MHLALLGDSVLDNIRYTKGGPDVAAQLGSILSPQGKVSLLAVDGATTGTVGPQLKRIPTGTTHLVLSLGGNDALQCMDVLGATPSNAGQAFYLLGERVARFEQRYRTVVSRLRRERLPLMLCTVYNGSFDAEFAIVAKTALAPFNDVIIRVALEHDLPLLDLRAVCVEAGDYELNIEPSEQGGMKIARAIADRLLPLEELAEAH